jgi:DnaJ-class molecular chaperone
MNVRKFSYFHNLLGVNESASNKEIKQAFRILALKYHPDREDGDKEMFQKIREAYEKILRDDDLRKEDEVLEAMRQAYVRGNTVEVWSLWENEIMEQKMPMGHEAFSYMFGACERGSVLEELNRAKEFGVLCGKEMEEAVYNAFLQHIALDMTSKDDIDFAMEVIDVMDKLHLTVDQRIARDVFSYMSGVS